MMVAMKPAGMMKARIMYVDDSNDVGDDRDGVGHRVGRGGLEVVAVVGVEVVGVAVAVVVWS